MTGPRSSFSLRVGYGVLLLALGSLGRGACPAPAPSSPSHRQSARMAHDQLSTKTRLEIFERTWREIHDHYYDPSFNGVNWDAIRMRYRPLVEAAGSDQRFYALMSEMAGELHDAHTRFNSPEQWRNYKKQQG